VGVADRNYGSLLEFNRSCNNSLPHWLPSLNFTICSFLLHP
jgi:hypothetical protein